MTITLSLAEIFIGLGGVIALLISVAFINPKEVLISRAKSSFITIGILIRSVQFLTN